MHKLGQLRLLIDLWNHLRLERSLLHDALLLLEEQLFEPILNQRVITIESLSNVVPHGLL